MELGNKAGVSELFLDLVEMEIARRYVATPQNKYNNKEESEELLCYVLDQYNALSLLNDTEIIISRKRDVASNDIENSRFAIQMSLHMNALNNVVSSFINEIIAKYKHSSYESFQTLVPDENMKCSTIDVLNDKLFPFLKKRPAPGTELDLRGRIVFYACDINSQGNTAHNPSIRMNTNTIDGDIEVLKKAASRKELILIVDPTELFVVRSTPNNDTNRAKIVFSFPLQAIIATATDVEWFHIAVSQAKDIGLVVENGKLI